MPPRKDWERGVCGASTRRFRLVPGVMKDLEPRM
jgi:hypothetical protein